MAGPAVAVRNVSAVIDPEALLQQRLVVELRGAVISITELALRTGIPSGAPVSLAQLAPDKILLKTSLTPIGSVAEIIPSAGEAGQLVIRIASLKAAGVIPIPSFM